MNKILQIRYIFLICLFLLFITLAVFFQVRNFDFVNFDDPIYVYENPHIQKGLTLKSIGWAFTSFRGSLWIPVTWLSFIVDYKLFGLNPGGYHLTNVFFHIINTLLLFLFLKCITGKLWRSAFVAALFAIHPLHVESVAWVTERKDVLCMFFMMLALWMYARYAERPSSGKYLSVFLLFGLGLMAKPMVVTFPFILLLLDYWPLGRFKFGNKDSSGKIPAGKHFIPLNKKINFSQILLEKIPLFALSITVSVITFIAGKTGEALISVDVIPLKYRIPNAIVSYVVYIRKTVWPNDLAVFYPHNVTLLPLWKIVFSGVFLMCITVIIIRSAQRFPYFIVGWFWYLGTLFPVIGIFQAGAQAMADRFTYIPVIGLFIITAWGIPEIIKKWRYRKVVLLILSGLLILTSATASWKQIQYWQDSGKLFEHTLNVTSDDPNIHLHQGLFLAKQGKSDEAFEHYSEALRLQSDYYRAHNNLGVLFADKGMFDDAVKHYTEALRLKPDYSEAHSNMANALINQAKYNEAVMHYSEALRLKPGNAKLHNDLANVFVIQSKYDEAIIHYKEALNLKQDYAEAHSNMAVVHARMGKLDDAVTHCKEALRLNPGHANIHNNMGAFLAEQGKYDEAIKHYREALRLKPDYTEARKNLENVLNSQVK